MTTFTSFMAARTASRSLIGSGREDAGLPNRLGQVKAGARQALARIGRWGVSTSPCYALAEANRFRCLNWLNSFGIFGAYKLA